MVHTLVARESRGTDGVHTFWSLVFIFTELLESTLKIYNIFVQQYTLAMDFKSTTHISVYIHIHASQDIIFRIKISNTAAESIDHLA